MMELDNHKISRRSGSRGGKIAFGKLLPVFFLGAGLGIFLCYSLITEFYFYQAVVAGVLCAPVLILCMIYSPRRSLLGLLVLTIPFNPSFPVLRDKSFAFSVEFLFRTSDLIMISIFVYLLISYTLDRAKKKKSYAPLWQLGLPLLLWVASGIVSIVPAVNDSIAIIELIRMLRMLLTFVAVFFLIENPKDIYFIIICLVLAFAIQTVLVLMEYGVGHPLLRLPGEGREADIVGAIFRPGGSMGHSSNFAKLAALCLPICLTLIFVVRKNVWRICAGLVLIGGLLALVLTVSRAGFVTSLFGLCWIALIMSKTRAQQKRAVALATLFFLIVGIGLAWNLGGNRLMSRMAEDYGSAKSRPQMFSVAWNVIKAHPFFGVGLNNYTLIAPDYDHTQEAISITFPFPVHNIYILYIAEMGIPGAACFLWFLVATVVLAFKCSSKVRPPLDSAVVKAIGVGIVCSWLQGLIGMGFRSSIVHTSYLAILAGTLTAFRYYNQNLKGNNLKVEQHF